MQLCSFTRFQNHHHLHLHSNVGHRGGVASLLHLLHSSMLPLHLSNKQTWNHRHTDVQSNNNQPSSMCQQEQEKISHSETVIGSLGHHHHHHPEKTLMSYFYVYLSWHFVKSAEMSGSVTAAQPCSHNPALLYSKSVSCQWHTNPEKPIWVTDRRV